MYVYVAVNEEGKRVKGRVGEEELEGLEEELERRGLQLIDLRPSTPLDVALEWLRVKLKEFSLKVSRVELIEFSRNLSVMLRSGVSLLVALEDITGETTNKGFREVLLAIIQDLRAGIPLSESFSKYPKVFPPIFEKLTRIGEETGRLDETFRDISDHLERIEELYSSIKRALMYPIFITIMTFGSLIFWFAYVLPKILSLFKEMDLKLPVTTVALVEVSSFMSSYWWLVVAVAALPFILGAFMRRWERTKYYVDWVILRIPIIKLIAYNGLIAVTSEYLRILTAAGIGVDKVFDLTMDSVGNEVMRKALRRVKERVMAGEGLSSSFRKEKIFPAFFVRMVSTGEASGNLDEQLGYVANFYFDKLSDISEKLGKMLEPVVLAVVGTVFAFVIIALFLPIYDLVGKMGM